MFKIAAIERRFWTDNSEDVVIPEGGATVDAFIQLAGGEGFVSPAAHIEENSWTRNFIFVSIAAI